ncbi:hypothetical protein EDEG_02941 [Edhazardia aedis USNM 41457]|uniref:Uncharacterized protein n=1 Tax=Edhazardia aedis (strain USNM 41457) TaxID=1003232 RepID=J8ZSM7_EDHAE|nr:hypothetical protein EDEG_02941 [Edhazardia aedis USNM 41457]|eukprot:EJW02658.1 hypothetical protein EDEG_02941 [Edhazardia aedis USNM 41457]
MIKLVFLLKIIASSDIQSVKNRLKLIENEIDSIENSLNTNFRIMEQFEKQASLINKIIQKSRNCSELSQLEAEKTRLQNDQNNLVTHGKSKEQALNEILVKIALKYTEFYAQEKHYNEVEFEVNKYRCIVDMYRVTLQSLKTTQADLQRALERK